jgi:signal transduction histidine kinase
VLHGGAVSLQVLAASVWLFFAVEYTGRSLQAARGCLLLSAGIAVGTSFLLLGNPASPLLWADYRLVAVGAGVGAAVTPGPWLVLALLTGASFLAVGLAILLEMAVADPRRFGRRTAILSLGVVAAAGAVIARYLGVVDVDASSLVVASVSPLLWAGLDRWSLFDATPATSRVGGRAALDDLGDAVLVLDQRRRVVDLNERAHELFDHCGGDPVATQVDRLFDDSVPLDDPEATVTLRNGRGYREFRLSASPVESARGEVIGRTVVLHDTTAESQRRQRFEVLNRVLRHNLRNGMNAVMGHASQLEGRVDGEAAEIVRRIESRTAEVAELGERAAAIERITVPETDPVAVNLETDLVAIADRLAARTDVTVDVDVTDGLALRTNRVVLEEATRNAGHSLLSVTETHPSRLWVSATECGDGWVEVTIRSNGAPVPPAERKVIESGEETPLSHGRGLDLWLVAWSVETLGGTLSFVDSGRPGIEIRIPDLPDDER